MNSVIFLWPSGNGMDSRFAQDDSQQAFNEDACQPEGSTRGEGEGLEGEGTILLLRIFSMFAVLSELLQLKIVCARTEIPGH